MTPEDIRAAMESCWVTGSREADELKDPFRAMERVTALYINLAEPERAAADEILAEWVMSEDEAKRYDAIALVRELRVLRAERSLRELHRRLAISGDPGAPFEREKVEGVLDELGLNGTRS